MLDVFATLRVGILTTGDELVAPGGPREAQQIYDSNGLMLGTLAAGMGAHVVRTVHMGDDERAIHATLRALRAQFDLIVTTGGASVGERDMTRSALTSLGASFVLRGMRMKPGKPAALARLFVRASSGFGGQCSEQ
ncbi:molybdopterin-binding protein [Paraburkholderia sp. BL10I2N1]|uniref:molybdopterin-binding protein n=1 Tax=Paraburkholderia sp. BL10I2N1 TaxID=1938796 RepID=UPI001FB646CD|nr:molybdopterin-binding protein [Paraburkholderia sp. BL10I2N1]